jgi:hypothetical protein
MKTIWGLFLPCLMVTASSAASSAPRAEPTGVVLEYFAACKRGDVEIIKDLAAGRFYEKRKSLLNSNAGYPDFLVQQFKGLRINIVQVSRMDENRRASVLVDRQYPDGSFLRTQFILEKYQGAWKIYDEQLISR